MLLKQIMKRGPLTVEDTDQLGAVYRTMTGARLRHFPVMQDGNLIGILSERDILEYRAKCGVDEDWWRTPVAKAMRSPVQTAGPDDSLSEAAGRMAAAKIGALPIVELGKLVGLITVTDVLAAEVDQAMR